MILLSIILAWLPISAAFAASPDKQWNPLRFAAQSSKFVTLPFTGPPKTTVIQPGDVLWEPGSKLFFEFAPLDDVVMGGVSASSFDNRLGIWTGTVTDTNNGGFIGIRSTPGIKLDMKNCKGIEVKVKLLRGPKADLRFKVATRDSSDFNGITWATSLDSKLNANTAWKVRFDKQVPTLFAKKMPDQSFDRTNVSAVQIVFSKFEYDGKLNPKFAIGDIQLQVLEIRAF